MQRYQPGSGGQPATWQSEAITNTYRYDQLNRIKSSRERQWNGTSTSWASPSNVHATNYSYDQNGNITQLQRRDAAGNLLDNITYTYETDENGNKINRLQEVNDPTVTADPSDIEGKHGFTYDQQGNLSRDEKEKTNIDWNNQNKVHQVRQEEADKAHITFRYDATGNRIEKEVNRNALLADGSRSYADPTKVVTTYYVRDAQGNVMSIYEKTHRQKDDGSYESVLTQKETYLYGSDRLGVDRQEKVVGITQSASAAEAVDAEIVAPEVVNTNSNTPPTSNGLLPNGDEVIVTPTSKNQNEDRSYWVLTTPGGELDLTDGLEVDVNNSEGFFAEVAAWEDIRTEEEVYVSRIIGKKQYELKDHLSNVRVVLSDQKEVVNVDETAGTYEQKAKVLAYYNYFPFGAVIKGNRMSYTLDFQRYGFNGKENDSWGTSGLVQDYGFRIYIPALGKFMSVDPLADGYPWYTPYQFAGNMPIWAIDLDGLEEKKVTGAAAITGTATGVGRATAGSTAQGAARSAELMKVAPRGSSGMWGAAFKAGGLFTGFMLSPTSTGTKDVRWTDEQGNEYFGDDLIKQAPSFNNDELEEIGKVLYSPKSDVDEDNDQYITFYRGEGYYDAKTTEATQSFNISKISELQKSYIPDFSGVLYLTTQSETAEYFSVTPERFGGGATLSMRVLRSDWNEFRKKYPDTVFEQPIPNMEKDFRTETKIPFRAVKDFENILKKGGGIKIERTTDERGKY